MEDEYGMQQGSSSAPGPSGLAGMIASVDPAGLFSRLPAFKTIDVTSDDLAACVDRVFDLIQDAEATAEKSPEVARYCVGVARRIVHKLVLDPSLMNVSRVVAIAEQRQLWDAVDLLWVDDAAHQLFRFPVTDEMAPVYSKVVPKPTSLTKIYGLLRSGGILDDVALLKELRLLVDNAKRYNGDESEIAAAAEALKGKASQYLSARFDRSEASMPDIHELFGEGPVPAPSAIDGLFAPPAKPKLRLTLRGGASPQPALDSVGPDGQASGRATPATGTRLKLSLGLGRPASAGPTASDPVSSGRGKFSLALPTASSSAATSTKSQAKNNKKKDSTVYWAQCDDCDEWREVPEKVPDSISRWTCGDGGFPCKAAKTSKPTTRRGKAAAAAAAPRDEEDAEEVAPQKEATQKRPRKAISKKERPASAPDPKPQTDALLPSEILKPLPPNLRAVCHLIEQSYAEGQLSREEARRQMLETIQQSATSQQGRGRGGARGGRVATQPKVKTARADPYAPAVIPDDSEESADSSGSDGSSSGSNSRSSSSSSSGSDRGPRLRSSRKQAGKREKKKSSSKKKGPSKLQQAIAASRTEGVSSGAPAAAAKPGGSDRASAAMAELQACREEYQRYLAIAESGTTSVQTIEALRALRMKVSRLAEPTSRV